MSFLFLCYGSEILCEQCCLATHEDILEREINVQVLTMTSDHVHVVEGEAMVGHGHLIGTNHPTQVELVLVDTCSTELEQEW